MRVLGGHLPLRDYLPVRCAIWTRLTVRNLRGSFLIGLISEIAQTRVLGIEPLLRIALTAGFLGGYTTFSSFAFETRTLAAEREWGASFGYALSSVVLGVAACYAGIVLARLSAGQA